MAEEEGFYFLHYMGGNCWHALVRYTQYPQNKESTFCSINTAIYRYLIPDLFVAQVATTSGFITGGEPDEAIEVIVPTRRNAEQRGAHSDAPVQPEVQRARQRLREMPPFAREREIKVRYSQFSPEEKELLRGGD